MYEAAAEMTSPQIPGVTPADYWRALITFLYLTGWRIGSSVALRWDQIEETDQGVVVYSPAEQNKGKRTFKSSCPRKSPGISRRFAKQTQRLCFRDAKSEFSDATLFDFNSWLQSRPGSSMRASGTASTTSVAGSPQTTWPTSTQWN